MPRRQNVTPEEQGGKSANSRKISVKPGGKKCAVPSKVKNPTSKMNVNNRNWSSRVTRRSTAFVPPNNITSTNTGPSISNGATVNVVVSALSPTPEIIRSSFDDPLGDRENDDVAYLYRVDSSATGRVVEEIDLSEESELQRPETIGMIPPFGTNVRTDDQDNDDVTYLYHVDTSAAGRVVEEVDLRQEPEEAEEPVLAGKKQTGAKNQKNLKRKAEGDKVSNKKSRLRNAPVCSVCNIDYDSLIDNAEHMLILSCGHLICQPCIREIAVSECQACGKKINRMCKVFF